MANVFTVINKISGMLYKKTIAHKKNNYISNTGTIAGFSLLVMFTFGILADSIIMPDLINWNDPFETARNISLFQWKFEIGILSYLIVLFADLAVAWALYFLLKPVNKSIALFMSWLRVLFVAVRISVMPNLLKVLLMVNVFKGTSTLSPTDIMTCLYADKRGYMLALIIFGFHIILLAYLVLKSDFIPNTIGILLFIAFSGYMINCVLYFLLPSYSHYEPFLLLTMAVPGVVSELSLCFWLLLKNKHDDLPRLVLSTNTN